MKETPKRLSNIPRARSGASRICRKRLDSPRPQADTPAMTDAHFMQLWFASTGLVSLIVHAALLFFAVAAMSRQPRPAFVFIAVASSISILAILTSTTMYLVPGLQSLMIHTNIIFSTLRLIGFGLWAAGTILLLCEATKALSSKSENPNS